MIFVEKIFPVVKFFHIGKNRERTRLGILFLSKHGKRHPASGRKCESAVHRLRFRTFNHCRNNKSAVAGKINYDIDEILVTTVNGYIPDKSKKLRVLRCGTDSACCLVDAEWAMSQQMQRMMKALKQEVPETKQILEINPDHPLIAALRDVLAKDAESPKLADYAKMLFDSARLMANLPIDDPRDFAKQIASLMADSLK